MKLLRNRKAAENWIMDTMPVFLLFVAVLGFSVFLFVETANTFILEDIEIPKNVEEHILIERFLNSPECFAYQDETGRTYNKVIDLNKFKSQSQIDKCITTQGSKFAFKLILDVTGSNEKFYISTSNWLERFYFKEEQRNVLVYTDDKINSEKLTIYTQNA